MSDWSRYHPALPEVLADPWPAYRWLRANAPVHRVQVRGDDFYVLSRHDHVTAAAKDPQRFSNASGIGFAHEPPEGGSLTRMDPPQHTMARRLTAGAFTPRAIELLGAAAEAGAASLVDRATAAGTIDVASELSMPYLSTLVDDWMGVPAEDRELVWAGAQASSRRMAGDVATETTATLTEWSSYFERDARRRRAIPRGDQPADLCELLFAPQADGQHLDDNQVARYESLLSVGGNETTGQFFSAVIELLAERPDLFELLVREPAGIHAMTEEALRYLGPTHGLFRTTTEDVDVEGVTIPVGTKVLLLYASANRDEAHYDAPDDFVPDRYPRGFADADHLTFATGVHVCLGAHLARMMTWVLLAELTDRCRGVQLAGPVVRNDNALVRGYRELPVRFLPIRPSGRRA